MSVTPKVTPGTTVALDVVGFDGVVVPEGVKVEGNSYSVEVTVPDCEQDISETATKSKTIVFISTP